MKLNLSQREAIFVKNVETTLFVITTIKIRFYAKTNQKNVIVAKKKKI